MRDSETAQIENSKINSIVTQKIPINHKIYILISTLGLKKKKNSNSYKYLNFLKFDEKSQNYQYWKAKRSS